MTPAVFVTGLDGTASEAAPVAEADSTYGQVHSPMATWLHASPERRAEVYSEFSVSHRSRPLAPKKPLRLRRVGELERCRRVPR